MFPWILEELQLRFGGSIRPDGNNDRRTWRWSVSGNSAECALIELGPHLYVKKTQARLVLEARRSSPGPERQAKVAEMKALKHHDYEHK